jgi:formylglycine-generating enzyme required for sulfatase activity
MGHDVFVSHSSKDKPHADAVVAALENHGVQCWVAPRDILPGDNWASSILRAIETSRLMVLIFSGNTNESPHVRREVERAVNRQIPVAPIRIEDKVPEDDLEYFLSGSHWMDAITQPFENHLVLLARQVRRILKMTVEDAAPSRAFAQEPIAPPPPPAAPAAPAGLTAASTPRERLAVLRRLFLDGDLRFDQFHLCEQLLNAKAAELSKFDALKLAEVNNMLEGRLSHDGLDTALAAVDAIKEKQDQLDREQKEQDRVARQAKIDSLLALAAVNNNRDHFKTAITALDELLKLDPKNAQAADLKVSIAKQFGPRVSGETSTNSIGMKLTCIPPGEFVMGSPPDEPGRCANETQHRVTLSRQFFIATTPITRGQFAEFVKETGHKTDAEKEGWAYAWAGSRFDKVSGASWRHPGFKQTDDHPVVEVSWNDAVAFTKWLSKKEGNNYRLPTEAEYEYCCRAGTQTAYPWGDNPEESSAWANCCQQIAVKKPAYGGFNRAPVNTTFTTPVGKFRPNAFGLCDMIGNIWEWCSDWFAEYPPGDATDPQGPPRGEARVLRGGSWSHTVRDCRCANRNDYVPYSRNFNVGFRPVLEFD